MLVPRWMRRDTDRAAVRQLVDVLELSFDSVGENKWIQAPPAALEGQQCRAIHAFRSEEAVQRGLGAVVDPADARAHPGLALEFHRGLEQVHHQAELVPVKVVHRRKSLGGLVAIPPQ